MAVTTSIQCGGSLTLARPALIGSTNITVLAAVRVDTAETGEPYLLGVENFDSARYAGWGDLWIDGSSSAFLWSAGSQWVWVAYHYTQSTGQRQFRLKLDTDSAWTNGDSGSATTGQFALLNTNTNVRISVFKVWCGFHAMVIAHFTAS